MIPSFWQLGYLKMSKHVNFIDWSSAFTFQVCIISMFSSSYANIPPRTSQSWSSPKWSENLQEILALYPADQFHSLVATLVWNKAVRHSKGHRYDGRDLSVASAYILLTCCPAGSAPILVLLLERGCCNNLTCVKKTSDRSHSFSMVDHRIFDYPYICRTVESHSVIRYPSWIPECFVDARIHLYQFPWSFHHRTEWCTSIGISRKMINHE